MNGFPSDRSRHPQPSRERHVVSGAQLGLVDNNPYHTGQFDARPVNHSCRAHVPPLLHYASAAPSMSGSPRDALPDHFGSMQAHVVWNAHQSGAVQVLRTRPPPPGEPPPDLTPAWAHRCSEPRDHPVLNANLHTHAQLPLPGLSASGGHLPHIPTADMRCSTFMQHTHPPPDFLGLNADLSNGQWHSPDLNHIPVVHHHPCDRVEASPMHAVADAAPVQWLATSSSDRQSQVPLDQAGAPAYQRTGQRPGMGHGVQPGDVWPSGRQHAECSYDAREYYTDSQDAREDSVQQVPYHRADVEQSDVQLRTFLTPSEATQEDPDAADLLLQELDAELAEQLPPLPKTPHAVRTAARAIVDPSIDRQARVSDALAPNFRAGVSAVPDHGRRAIGSRVEARNGAVPTPVRFPAAFVPAEQMPSVRGYTSYAEHHEIVPDPVMPTESLQQLHDPAGSAVPPHGDSPEQLQSVDRPQCESPLPLSRLETRSTSSHSPSYSPASGGAFCTPERHLSNHRHKQPSDATTDPNSHSHTSLSGEKQSDVESGEIIDSDSPGDSTKPSAQPPEPIRFILEGQQPQPRPPPEPRSTPMRSMFLCPRSDDPVPDQCDEVALAELPGTLPANSALAPNLGASSHFVQSSQPVAISAAAPESLEAPTAMFPADRVHPVAPSVRSSRVKHARIVELGSLATAVPHNRVKQTVEGAPILQFRSARIGGPNEPRINEATKARARRSLSPSAKIRKSASGHKSRQQLDLARARLSARGARDSSHIGSGTGQGGAREPHLGDVRSAERVSARQASPTRRIGGEKRSRDSSVKKASSRSPIRVAVPVNPMVTGVDIVERSKASEGKELPHPEKDESSAQDAGGLEQLAALSHIRDSIRQQLKMRKQRAAEPFDLATSSVEPIAVTSQHTAADAPADPLAFDTSAKDTCNGAPATRMEVSPDVEVHPGLSHRVLAAQGLKDRKLVCLEFCQCVCLTEEPAGNGFCSLGEQECTGIHDRDLVVPCPASTGQCRRQGCLLQHKVVPRLMPMCIFFFKGHCRNGGSCMYAHMDNVAPRAPVCPDFLRGFCPDGEQCTMKHFTQRTLMEYYMRPQDYESLILVAEKSWGMPCDPASDNEDCIQPYSSQCALDSNAQVAPDWSAGSQEDTSLVQEQTAAQQVNVGADHANHSEEGGVLHAAAAYIRLNAAYGGLHIGGIYLPQLDSAGVANAVNMSVA